MEILIVKLSAIGDVIHTLPALDALHRKFPESNITWLVEEKAGDIVTDHPCLHRVIVSKRKKWLEALQNPTRWYSAAKEITIFLRELRSREYDLVIDFQGLLKSGLLVFLSRGKKKIGYDKTRELSYLFLDKKVPPYPLNRHAVERNMNLVMALDAGPDGFVFDQSEKKDNYFADGCQTMWHHPTRFAMSIGEEEKRTVQHFLTSKGIQASRPLVTIHSQAGWVTKLWQPFKWAELSDKLIETYGAQIVFTGEKDDHPSTEAILSLMENKAINGSGQTSLKELAYLLRLSNLMITTDSGPMHIASAMGTPVLALFGPTAPWRTGPYSHHSVVIRKTISCSPCFKRKCKSQTCMEMISVHDVFNAAHQELESGDGMGSFV